MDVSSQQYYVLLSGRWYKSTSLNGKWNYVASDKLPADFAKIPEGSPKDNVLPSVAGTLAANDAVLNAQVPQTARLTVKMLRQTSSTTAIPRFDDIDGTDIAYAVNTPGYVIRWRGVYYAVDNGVWFQAYHPNGHGNKHRASLCRFAYPPRYPVCHEIRLYIRRNT